MRDLEVYIRDADFSAVLEWLADHLDGLDALNEPVAGKPCKAAGYYRGGRVRVSLYPDAGGKRYTSLILEGDDLPWESDLACGRSAWRALESEIRCSPGDWKEGEPVQDEKWWRLDQRGEQLAVWN